MLEDASGNPVNSLEEKLSRLLGYYESTLPDGQKSILSGMSLLSRPIDEESLIALTRLDSYRRGGQFLPQENAEDDINCIDDQDAKDSLQPVLASSWQTS